MRITTLSFVVLNEDNDDAYDVCLWSYDDVWMMEVCMYKDGWMDGCDDDDDDDDRYDP